MKFDRDKLINIVSDGATFDSFGQPNSEEIIFSDIFASIVPIVGKEYIAAGQMQSEVKMKVEIEYMEGISAKMIVIYGSRRLEIVDIINLKERNTDLLLMCKELS